MLLASLLAVGLAQQPAPLPEGNAFGRGLLGRQRAREQALNKGKVATEQAEVRLSAILERDNYRRFGVETEETLQPPP